MVEDNLAAEAGVLVEDACARVALQHVLLVVGARREPFKPFLGDADLALGRAGVDVLKAVGGRLDHPAVRQSLQQGLPRQPHHLALVAIRVHREQLHDAIRHFLRGGGGGGGGAGGGGGGGGGARDQEGFGGDSGGESLEAA
jgi:uncharacterized membrane protein YgcG